MHQNIEAIDYKEETEDIIRKFERKEDFVYYTSGSTGKPKKIVHSYELMKMVAEENCRYNNYAKHDYIVNMSLPAASIGYPVLSVLPALISGCQLKIRAFNPYDYLDEIQEATHAFILPAVYRVLKKTDGWKNANLVGMTLSCGADIVPEGIKDDVLSKGAIKFHHLYGSTEVPPAISNSEDERQIGQNLSPLIEHYVEEKELFIKWKMQDVFWRSGDVVDDDLKVVGRKKNILALNCSRLHPETIERHVLDNTDANRCMLTIKNDKVWMYFEGNVEESMIKECVQEWFVNSSVVVRKVKKIEVNKMNKIVRSASYDNG
jgi:long-subunit acyl-CoA synthetase (AMP-forming)